MRYTLRAVVRDTIPSREEVTAPLYNLTPNIEQKMMKTIIALLALGSVASAASIGYSSMDSALQEGVVLGLDWNGGASKNSVNEGTVTDGALVVGTEYGGSWQNINPGTSFTLTFDISKVSAASWNTILSVASEGWAYGGDGGRLQMQADGSGNLYLYNTANTDAYGNPVKDSQYFGGFIHGSESVPSSNNISLGLTLSDTQTAVTTLTFVADATAGTFTAYNNGDQVGQWTGWNPTESMVGFQFAKRFGDNGRGNVTSATIDNLTLWNRALSATEVSSLIVPEPATATLSLLALAGLAARRRRK